MDFRKGQEAMAVAAIFHERRLQRRFDANDFREVDIALEGLAGRRFEIELFKSCSIDDDHPSFFGVARINEHAPSHGLAPEAFGPSRRERPAAKPPLWREGDGAPSTRRTAKPRPRRGSIAPPDHNWVLPTSVFLIVTACLTILWRDPPRPFLHCKKGRQRWPGWGLPSERCPTGGASNDGDCSRDATYGVRHGATIKRLREMNNVS